MVLEEIKINTMKNTRKFLMLSLVLLSTQFIYAQGADSNQGEMKPGEKGVHQNPAEKLKSELNLTPVQFESVKKIMIDTKAARDKNESTYANDENAKMKGQKAIRDQADEKILAILDPAQRTKFLVLKAEKKEEHKAKENPEERANKKAAELTTKLSLSANQTAKVKEVFKIGFTKIDGIKAKHKDNEEAAKEEIKPVKKEMERTILSLLTEAQKVKYKEYLDKKK